MVAMNCQALLVFAMLSLCCHYVHAVKTASLLVSINQGRDQIQLENEDSSPDHMDLQLGGHGDVGEYIKSSSCILAIIQLAPCNKFVQFHGAAASETPHRMKFVGLLSLVFPSNACARLQPILLASTSVYSPQTSCMQTCGEIQHHVQWYISRVLSIIFDLLNFAIVIWKHSCFTH
jgi:hypothetical protein